MAGWDEEALLIASLVVEETPDSQHKQKKVYWFAAFCDSAYEFQKETKGSEYEPCFDTCVIDLDNNDDIGDKKKIQQKFTGKGDKEAVEASEEHGLCFQFPPLVQPFCALIDFVQNFLVPSVWRFVLNLVPLLVDTVFVVSVCDLLLTNVGRDAPSADSLSALEDLSHKHSPLEYNSTSIYQRGRSKKSSWSFK